MANVVHINYSCRKIIEVQSQTLTLLAYLEEINVLIEGKIEADITSVSTLFRHRNVGESKKAFFSVSIFSSFNDYFEKSN